MVLYPFRNKLCLFHLFLFRKNSLCQSLCHSLPGLCRVLSLFRIHFNFIFRLFHPIAGPIRLMIPSAHFSRYRQLLHLMSHFCLWKQFPPQLTFTQILLNLLKTRTRTISPVLGLQEFKFARLISFQRIPIHLLSSLTLD